MMDVIAHMRLQQDLLFFSHHTSTVDQVSDDMTDLGNVRVCGNVVAIGQNKSRQPVWICFKHTPQLVKFHTNLYTRVGI